MNFEQTINNITFHISFSQYNKVSAAMRALIITVITIAATFLKLPEHVKIEFINHASWAYYPQRNKLNGVCVYGEGIRIFKLSMSDLAWVLAHELGHAEHFHLHPESVTWGEPRVEAYAIAVSGLLEIVRKTGKLPEFYKASEDIRVFEGVLLRK